VTELEQVKKALAQNGEANRESLERMEMIRREGVKRDLKAGKRVLRCCCDECLQEALALREPNPLTCQRARTEAERERKAALTTDIEILDKK
jgi:hypothetical protein